MMLHLHETITVRPGKNQEYLEIVRQVMPIKKRMGWKLVGFWQTALGTGKSNEFVAIWEFEDFAHFERLLKETLKEEKALKAYERADAIRTYIDKFLIPTDFSPMK